MRVQDPDKMSKAFVDAFNLGDVNELVSLYEPGANYVDGERTVAGSAAIREVLTQLTAVRPKMEMTNEYCVVCADTALVRARWKMHWRDSTKQLLVKTGHSSEVLRRGSDGVWRYIIDHPTGGD